MAEKKNTMVSNKLILINQIYHLPEEAQVDSTTSP